MIKLLIPSNKLPSFSRLSLSSSWSIAASLSLWTRNTTTTNSSSSAAAAAHNVCWHAQIRGLRTRVDRPQSSVQQEQRLNKSQRVWNNDSSTTTTTTTSDSRYYWKQPIVDTIHISSLLERIGKQELQGGRMRQRQLGVLREDPSEDMRLLMENYTVASLASALRDREEVLQHAAELLKHGNMEQVTTLLRPFEHEHVLARREPFQNLSLTHELNGESLELLRKALMRMPRRVTSAHQKRAGVVLCLANVHGVPSLLLEKRATTLRAHPDEVCLPGGISMDTDQSIVATCLREMHEEIMNLPEPVNVLGILRCNWGDVHHLVGVAVTPLVAFVGEVGDLDLQPNPDEVAEVFTIPLVALLKREFWIHREGFAPIFVGGPHVIWGLTGYIVERFVKDILLRYTVSHPSIVTAEDNNHHVV